LPSSAWNGIIIIVTPGSSRHAGTINNKLFPPPIGSTTTSGVCPTSTASTPRFCLSDRNNTLLLLSAYYIALSICSALYSLIPSPIFRKTSYVLRASDRPHTCFCPTFTAFNSPGLVLSTPPTPRNQYHTSLSGRNVFTNRMLKCLIISLDTPY
jgi:hypothetical protein